MKFCQKCLTAIDLHINNGKTKEEVISHGHFYLDVNHDPVSESECEFWAHVALKHANDALLMITTMELSHFHVQ